MNKLFNFLITGLELAIMAAVHLVILAFPFIENVRRNLFEMVSALLENGLIGYAVLLLLFSTLRPTIKLWYFMVLERDINMNLFKLAIEKTDLEQKFSAFIWFYLPVILVIYVFFF